MEYFWVQIQLQNILTFLKYDQLQQIILGKEQMPDNDIFVIPGIFIIFLIQKRIVIVRLCHPAPKGLAMV